MRSSLFFSFSFLRKIFKLPAFNGISSVPQQFAPIFHVSNLIENLKNPIFAPRRSIGIPSEVFFEMRGGVERLLRAFIAVCLALECRVM